MNFLRNTYTCDYTSGGSNSSSLWNINFEFLIRNRFLKYPLRPPLPACWKTTIFIIKCDDFNNLHSRHQRQGEHNSDPEPRGKQKYPELTHSNEDFKKIKLSIRTRNKAWMRQTSVVALAMFRLKTKMIPKFNFQS